MMPMLRTIAPPPASNGDHDRGPQLLLGSVPLSCPPQRRHTGVLLLSAQITDEGKNRQRHSSGRRARPVILLGLGFRYEAKMESKLLNMGTPMPRHSNALLFVALQGHRHSNAYY